MISHTRELSLTTQSLVRLLHSKRNIRLSKQCVCEQNKRDVQHLINLCPIDLIPKIFKVVD